MEAKGWALFCIFAATILAIILKPLPMGTIALLALLTTSLTGIIDLSKQGIKAFSSPVIWMIVFTLCVARGFIKTRLGHRIGYYFIYLFGKSTLGLGYSLIFSELLVAPFIPSNSARAGGIMLPIIKSISGSLDEQSSDKRGIASFLTQIAFQGNVLTSAMFLTAMAANPMAQSIAAAQGVEITWTNWALAASLPGLISVILIPLLIYFIYPPGTKKTPRASALAKANLAELGPISKPEWIMIAVFFMMLVLWVSGPYIGISAITTALIGLCLLLITNVLSWKDVMNETQAWNILVWLSILVMMSDFLEKYGFIKWFGEQISTLIAGMNPFYTLLILNLVYFYSHYLFASNTAHVASMYGPFLAISLSANCPPLLSALTLAFTSNLFSSMTHYGTTSGPILFSPGYVSLKSWWYVGLVVSVASIVIWLTVGSLWWKIIGLY